MYTFKPIKRDIEICSFVAAMDETRPKGFDFEGEMHDFWELVYIKSGCVIATADDRVYEVTTGQLLFHKPLEFHRIKSAYDSTPRLFNISFTAKGERMKNFENKFFELTDNQQARYEEINKLVREIVRLYNHSLTKTEQYTALSSKAAIMLESLLLEIDENSQEISKKSTEHEKQFADIISVLNQNCEKDLSVDEIASLCNMSTSNLKKIFNMYSDIGVGKYYLKLKLRRACEMISNGVSTAEIAFNLSFSSVAYFNTVFKREMGITPAQYRKVRR